MAAELVRKWETAQPRVAPIMDSGRAFRAREGDEGREPARSGGVGALGANFTHQRSEEIGSKRGEEEEGGGDDFVPILELQGDSQFL